MPVLQQVGPESIRETAGNAEERIGFLLRFADAKAAGKLREDFRVRSRLADGLDDRSHQLQADRPVALRDVVVLEKRRRRQDYISVAAGVGEHLLVDDGEEVLALQAPQDAILIRHRRQRIAVVDEEHLHRRVIVVEERPAQVIHVDEAGRRFGCVVHPGRGFDPKGRRVAHREAAAADAEFSCDRGERQTAAAALPPLRFRSSPQPHRMTAGERRRVQLGKAIADRRRRFRHVPPRARMSIPSARAQRSSAPRAYSREELGRRSP